MKYLAQLSIIAIICVIGDFLSDILPFAFPATILSMLLLVVLLLSKILKEKHIHHVADFLLNNMAFFYIPAGVAIIEKYHLLQGKVLPFLFICFASTVLTFLATAYTMKLVINLQNRKETTHERTND